MRCNPRSLCPLVGLGLVLSAIIAPQAAPAGDDFSALLEDLSFAGPQRSRPAASAFAAAPRQQAPATFHPTAAAVDHGITLPPAATLSAPIAGDRPETAKFDMAAAVAVQQMELGLAAAPAQTVGCIKHEMNGCDGCADCGCQTEAPVCIPRRPVQLPTSTFLEYFSSDPCHTGVWDGYQRGCSRLYEGCEPCKKKGGCAGGGCGEILPPVPRTRAVRARVVPVAPSCDSCDG